MKYLFLSILIFGCSAAKHLQLAKWHELKAISKGAKISTRRDSVAVLIPGKDTTIYINKSTSIDDFFADVRSNDSLVLLFDSLKHELKTGNATSLFQESLIKKLSAVKVAKAAVEKILRLDTVIYFKPDTLTSIKVAVKGKNIEIDFKRKQVNDLIKVTDSTTFEAKSGYNLMIVVGISLLSVVIGFIIGYLLNKFL